MRQSGTQYGEALGLGVPGVGLRTLQVRGGAGSTSTAEGIQWRRYQSLVGGEGVRAPHDR